MEGLQITWSTIVAIIGAITLLWGFYKTSKEIKAEIHKPFDEISKKVDGLNDEIKELKEDINKQDEALRAVLKKDILTLAEKCFKKGFVTTREKETIHSLFESYQNEGGNSFVSSLIDDVDKLPVEATE